MVATWPYTATMPTERTAEAKTNLRVPADVLETMRLLARADQRSLNGEIIVALREFIERRSATPQK